MTMRAVITFEGAQASLIRTALRPEAGREIPRAHVSVQGAGDVVVIELEATDTPALRAGLNSYLRWTQVAMDVNRMVTG